ncbi:MAG: hypothetical protein HQL26_02165 [Candidatus Omnitrophica bacterium]|nr:hypothetical protein [Candidatus Omnitrophota bacterium]
MNHILKSKNTFFSHTITLSHVYIVTVIFVFCLLILPQASEASGVVARQRQQQQQQMIQAAMQQQAVQQATQQYIQQRMMVQAAQQQAVMQAAYQKAVIEKTIQAQMAHQIQERYRLQGQMQTQMMVQQIKRETAVAMATALQQKMIAEKMMAMAYEQQAYQIAVQKKMLAEQAYQQAVYKKIAVEKAYQEIAVKKVVRDKMLKDRYGSTTEQGSSDAEITDLWADLEASSQVWPLMIDTEPKVLTVQRQIDLYKQDGVTIKKDPMFYVQTLDSMAEQNPDMFKAPFKELLKIAAVIEYDFDNGQNKDAMAKAVLGEKGFQQNKQRVNGGK